MFVIGVGFAAASLCLLLRELLRAPEGFEDEEGLTIIQPKESHPSVRKIHGRRSPDRVRTPLAIRGV